MPEARRSVIAPFVISIEIAPRLLQGGWHATLNSGDRTADTDIHIWAGQTNSHTRIQSEAICYVDRLTARLFLPAKARTFG